MGWARHPLACRKQGGIYCHRRQAHGTRDSLGAHHLCRQRRNRSFKDVESDLPADFVEQNGERLKIVDCITCHNRIAHKLHFPEVIDDAMSRKIISPEIPYFKQNALAIMSVNTPRSTMPTWRSAGCATTTKPTGQTITHCIRQRLSRQPNILLLPSKTLFTPPWVPVGQPIPTTWGTKTRLAASAATMANMSTRRTNRIRIECNLCHTVPVKNLEDGATPKMPLEES